MKLKKTKPPKKPWYRVDVGEEDLDNLIEKWTQHAQASIKYARRRTTYLNQILKRAYADTWPAYPKDFPLYLNMQELEWLYAVYTKHLFYNKHDSYFRQKCRQYCEIIGKRRAKVIFKEVTQNCLQQDVQDTEHDEAYADDLVDKYLDADPDFLNNN